MRARPIKSVLLHCSATKPTQKVTVEDINDWHRARGWDGIGYHYVIYRDGSIHTGRQLDVQGAHAIGFNKKSIGVCYIGGIDKDGEWQDNMTKKQEAAFRDLYKSLCTVFGSKLNLYGHNDLTPAKACPSFKVKSKFKDLYD